MTGGFLMGREGIESYEKIFECQILDKYNLTDRKVPAVTIKGGYLRFNLNAIHLLNDIPFVELLINPDEKYMLVVPCGEYDVCAMDWCKVSRKTGRTESRDIRSKFFSPKLYNLMGWDANHSYKVQCFYQTFDNGKCLLFFDLTEYVTMVQASETMPDGSTRKRTKPYYLADWQDSFGPPLQTLVSKVNQDFMAYYVVESPDSPNAQQLALFENDVK